MSIHALSQPTAIRTSYEFNIAAKLAQYLRLTDSIIVNLVNVMMDKFFFLLGMSAPFSIGFTVVAIASHLVIYLRYFALIAVDGNSCWLSTVQFRMHLVYIANGC